MGDRFRFRTFAEFIREQFPEARRIADVAGGRGLLAVELMRLGLSPTVIEPRHVDRLPRKVRKRFQVEAIRGGKLPSVARVERPVEDADLAAFDLVVALHPDEATEPTIRRAVALQKPFAVVPCCVMPTDGIQRTFDEWLSYLASLAPDCTRHGLAMAGANVAIIWRPV